MREMTRNADRGTFDTYRVVPPGEIYYFFTVMPSGVSRVSLTPNDRQLTNLHNLRPEYRERLFHHNRFHPRDLSTRHIAPAADATSPPPPTVASPLVVVPPLLPPAELVELETGASSASSTAKVLKPSAGQVNGVGGGAEVAGLPVEPAGLGCVEGGDAANGAASDIGIVDATKRGLSESGQGAVDGVVLTHLWGGVDQVPVRSMNVRYTHCRRTGPLALMVCCPRVDTQQKQARPPTWSLRHSVFAPREKETDSKAFLETPR